MDVPICGPMAAVLQCKTGRVQASFKSPAHNLRTFDIFVWKPACFRRSWCILFCYIMTNKQWAVAANGLVLRECFLVQHLWWIWLKPSQNYHSCSVWVVVAYRGTSYHTPGVWVVTPPACTLGTPLSASSLQHTVLGMNKQTKYSCYLSFKCFLSLPSPFLPAPPII